MTEHSNLPQSGMPRSRRFVAAMPLVAAVGTMGAALQRTQPTQVPVPLSATQDRGRLASHEYRAIPFPDPIRSRDVAILKQRQENAEIEWREWRFGDQS